MKKKNYTLHDARGFSIDLEDADIKRLKRNGIIFIGVNACDQYVYVEYIHHPIPTPLKWLKKIFTRQDKE